MTQFSVLAAALLSPLLTANTKKLYHNHNSFYTKNQVGYLRNSGWYKDSSTFMKIEEITSDIKELMLSIILS